LERFDTVGFWASSFVADSNRISLLHRYGDLALPEYGQYFRQDA
jgi:hypothetical protein